MGFVIFSRRRPVGPVAVVLGTAPAAPSGLASVDFPALNPANLLWVDNSSDETSFRLERMFEAPTGAWALVTDAIAANAQAYTEAAALAGSSYKWRLRAENAAGVSEWVESEVYLLAA